MRKLQPNIRYFVLDMDGTFYLGNQLLEGSLEFLEKVKEAGKDFIFFTNNSSRNRETYLEKLAGMNCHISEDQLLTSGMVTIDYIKSTWQNPKVYLLGTPALEKDFSDNGIRLTDKDPDAVVVGFDTTLTYEKLSKACTLIRNNVPFLATHPDNNCPTEFGPIPDCGAMCAFITRSTDVKPRYLGKPYAETMNYITKYLNCSREELVFVGDRLYTDIAIAARHGATSVLVLTGETGPEDVQHSQYKPDIIADRLIDLAACF
ncbi:MAG: HAD-IIA family hydrolase [Caldicoprobacterales bacterium]|jgi:4-nitrophenyl phosphatase|nr:HAD-IIA family hydrolase [Clostridiales bacterium]